MRREREEVVVSPVVLDLVDPLESAYVIPQLSHQLVSDSVVATEQENKLYSAHLKYVKFPGGLNPFSLSISTTVTDMVGVYVSRFRVPLVLVVSLVLMELLVAR